MDKVLRFRRYLDRKVEIPVWPAGFHCRTLLPGDRSSMHRLLRAAFAHDAGVPDFSTWWTALSLDDEFDPALCFLAVGDGGRIAGVAQCWTSSFLKDLAVDPQTRCLGLGGNLLRHAFQVFRERGEPYLDLKVESSILGAIGLYQRLGMQQVPIAG